MYHIFIIRPLNLDDDLKVDWNCGNHISSGKQLKIPCSS